MTVKGSICRSQCVIWKIAMDIFIDFYLSKNNCQINKYWKAFPNGHSKQLPTTCQSSRIWLGECSCVLQWEKCFYYERQIRLLIMGLLLLRIYVVGDTEIPVTMLYMFNDSHSSYFKTVMSLQLSNTTTTVSSSTTQFFLNLRQSNVNVWFRSGQCLSLAIKTALHKT